MRTVRDRFLPFPQLPLFLQFISHVPQTDFLKSGPSGIAGIRIPSLEFVKPGFEFVELVSVQGSFAIIMIIPLSILNTRQIGLAVSIPGGFFLIDDIGKMNHVPVTALQGPDGMVQVPDLSAEIDPVQEGKIFSGYGFQIFRLGRYRWSRFYRGRED